MRVGRQSQEGLRSAGSECVELLMDLFSSPPRRPARRGRVAALPYPRSSRNSSTAWPARSKINSKSNTTATQPNSIAKQNQSSQHFLHIIKSYRRDPSDCRKADEISLRQDKEETGRSGITENTRLSTRVSQERTSQALSRSQCSARTIIVRPQRFALPFRTNSEKGVARCLYF
jgi:hypothetical protein